MSYDVYESGLTYPVARFDTREHAEAFIQLQRMTDVRCGREPGIYFVVEK